MTSLWSVTQWAFASCAPPLSTTLEQGGATEASKTMEEVKVPMTMESDDGKLDSRVCEEGIEIELDKPPYHANAIREDAHFHGMIDATKDNIDDLAQVEDATLTHGKGIVNHATTAEAALQSNTTTLKKKKSLLFKFRWPKKPHFRADANKGQMPQIIGEVPDSTVVSLSEDSSTSSTDSMKEKKGRVDSPFHSQEENCIGKAEDIGMVTGENKPMARDLGKTGEDRAKKPYPGHVLLKQIQQKSRTHVRDDVSTLSSSTGGDGSSKNTESSTFDKLSTERKCSSLAQVDKLNTVAEKHDRDDISLAKNNDTLPLKIHKLIDNGDTNMPQVTKHRADSIQNTIVKDVFKIQKHATFLFQNDHTSICEPSSTVKSIEAIPQGSTLSKIPICQYDVALMKPLFEPEDDDSDDEDDNVNLGVGILKMVAKQTLAKECFQMDMNEPNLCLYNFNNCNQCPKTQNAAPRLSQGQHHVTDPSSPMMPFDNTTSMDTVEISVAENDENRDTGKPSKKGLFSRFRTTRRERSAPSRETVQYNVSPIRHAVDQEPLVPQQQGRLGGLIPGFLALK